MIIILAGIATYGILFYLIWIQQEHIKHLHEEQAKQLAEAQKKVKKAQQAQKEYYEVSKDILYYAMQEIRRCMRRHEKTLQALKEKKDTMKRKALNERSRRRLERKWQHLQHRIKAEITRSELSKNIVDMQLKRFEKLTETQEENEDVYNYLFK